MEKLFLLLFMLISLSMSGCGTREISTQQAVIPVEEPQVLQVKIVEGKTTKQEVIDALGMPKSLSTGSMSYYFDNNKSICKLSWVQKDGTTINVILGKGNKYQYDKLNLSFDYKNHSIIDRIHIL